MKPIVIPLSILQYPLKSGAGFSSAWKSIERFARPLIAAVNGWALGGGCELLLADVVVVGDNARIGLPEVTIAAFPGDGGAQRLPRAIGKTRAMWMMMSGETSTCSSRRSARAEPLEGLARPARRVDVAVNGAARPPPSRLKHLAALIAERRDAREAEAVTRMHNRAGMEDLLDRIRHARHSHRPV